MRWAWFDLRKLSLHRSNKPRTRFWKVVIPNFETQLCSKVTSLCTCNQISPRVPTSWELAKQNKLSSFHLIRSIIGLELKIIRGNECIGNTLVVACTALNNWKVLRVSAGDMLEQNLICSDRETYCRDERIT